jgi:hypothetical protein
VATEEGGMGWVVAAEDRGQCMLWEFGSVAVLWRHITTLVATSRYMAIESSHEVATCGITNG